MFFIVFLLMVITKSMYSVAIPEPIASKKISNLVLARQYAFDDGYAQEKDITVVIPSYNNKDWYLKNLDSVFMQDYSRYRVVYIDDASTDGTADLVDAYIQKNKLHDKIMLIRNTQRNGHLANYYKAIHATPDDHIIVMLDGDDWLAHQQVFKVISNTYRKKRVWLTYGQFESYPYARRGLCCQFSPFIIKNNLFRYTSWRSSHLRTCYAWLFKCIDLQDLQYEDAFIPVAADVAMMMPMLEMAGERIQYISQVLLIYNRANVINCDKLYRDRQVFFDKVTRSRPPYARLVEKPVMQDRRWKGSFLGSEGQAE